MMQAVFFAVVTLQRMERGGGVMILVGAERIHCGMMVVVVPFLFLPSIHRRIAVFPPRRPWRRCAIRAGTIVMVLASPCVLPSFCIPRPPSHIIPLVRRAVGYRNEIAPLFFLSTCRSRKRKEDRRDTGVSPSSSPGVVSLWTLPTHRPALCFPLLLRIRLRPHAKKLLRGFPPPLHPTVAPMRTRTVSRRAAQRQSIAHRRGGGTARKRKRCPHPMHSSPFSCVVRVASPKVRRKSMAILPVQRR